MEIVLQVLGALFIGVLAVAAFYGWKVIRWFKKIKNQIIAASLAPATPSRICLKNSEDRSWMEQEAVSAQVLELKSLGFSDALPFVVEEMYDLEIIGQVHEKESVFAVTYHGHDGTVWVDLCAEKQNGESFTVTNTKQPMKLDTRPGKSLVVEPNLGAKAMLEKLLALRGTGPFTPASSLNFKQMFEQQYAQDMDWRNSRGGSVSWEEFERTAQATEYKLTQEQLREAYFNTVYAAGVLRLSAECVEAFQNQGSPVASATTQHGVLEDREGSEGFFALHQHIPGTHFEQFIKDHIGGLDDTLLEQFKAVFDASASAQENFSKFIDLLPTDVRPIKVGDVDFPVAAEIFQAPVCVQPVG